MHNAIFALVILVLSLTASAGASQLDDAVTAVHKGDYAIAQQLLRDLAEKGDARAQFNIGCMYANGWGVPRNNAEAVKWYHSAANQGLAIAQHFLGIAYAYGDGVEPDVVEAAKWFRRAAEQGHPPAQFVLGVLHLDGKGVPKDPVQAYAWIVLSGRRGVQSAARMVPTIMLTSDQLAKAQEIADRWKPQPESSVASVADPRPEELPGLDPHVGELADPASWPASAIGVVAIARFSQASWCSGALVGPKIALTAAHCVFAGKQLVSPGNVHFLAGMNKGVPAVSSIGEQLIVSKDFVPGEWTLRHSGADWALIVLKDAMPFRPLPVRPFTKEELKAASLGGTVSEIGYGKERRYSPTVLRNCRADQAEDVRILMVRCLANFGYSGSPILAEVNGTPTVIGIFSAFQPETREMFACSASQFEETLKQLIRAQLTAHH
jgi:V8-like Glu-specific endopeptidase